MIDTALILVQLSLTAGLCKEAVSRLQTKGLVLVNIGMWWTDHHDLTIISVEKQP